MKGIDLLNITEQILKGQDVSQKDYTSALLVVKGILYNYGVKHINADDVFQSFLLKLFTRKDEYNFDMAIYQKLNYITQYILKSAQETVKTAYNIIDISGAIIDKGNYTHLVYAKDQHKILFDELEEFVEDEYRLHLIYEKLTAKERYIIQRRFIDGVENRTVARELKIRPDKASRMYKKIINNLKSSLLN